MVLKNIITNFAISTRKTMGKNKHNSYNVLTGIIACVLMVSCSTLTTAEREAKEVEWKAYVVKCIDDRHYKIDVNMMNPHRGTSKILSSSWSLEVKGDTLDSYLPYFGRAYEPVYGETKVLNFNAPIKSYEDSGFMKGKRTIRIHVDNSEDIINYKLEVTEDGYACIDVYPRKREDISFSGLIVENKDH